MRSDSLTAAIVAAALAVSRVPPTPAAADPADGLSGRLVVGYQGWFGCPGDYEGNKDWQHWFVKAVRAEFLTVDILPSVGSLPAEELCDTGLPRQDGRGTVKLFSAQNADVVKAHFAWMRKHGIDGAAAQRFLGPVASDARLRSRSDHVLENVAAAAEASGRTFFVVYDVSGANPSTVTDDLRSDWRHLVETLRLTAGKAYQQDHGKPLLELWGFGFKDHPGEPEAVAALVADLKSGAHGLPPATVIGGVPTHWRTLSNDARPEPAWQKVYQSYDVISPWSVGRFADEQSADAFAREVVEPDLAATRSRGQRYLPVAFPGFSWANLMRNRDRPEEAIVNRIPRDCGRFLWRQVSNLLELHVNALYVAMFDEADEGTAIFAAEPNADALPAHVQMVYLNEDGCSLPDDWYMRIAGKAAEYLRASTPAPRHLEAVLRP
jgi:hypothetical protein